MIDGAVSSLAGEKIVLMCRAAVQLDNDQPPKHRGATATIFPYAQLLSDLPSH